MPSGAGPRHLVFGPDGNYVYLLTELSAELMVLRWDASRGQLALFQTVGTTNPEFQGAKSGAEAAVGADGRFIYVENRAENALVVYRVDRISGELTQIQRISSGGQKAWWLGIDPSRISSVARSAYSAWTPSRAGCSTPGGRSTCPRR